LLSLGIPGDAVTAILVGAFILHGLTPGPMLFETNPDMISAIFIGMMIVQFMFLILGLNFAHHFARLLTVPRPVLNTIILTLCVVGTYGVQNSIYDIGTMLVFAVLGYIMARTGIPRAPIVLALILGPLMEENLRRWMALTEGNYVSHLMGAFSTNPIAMFVFGLTLLTLILPIFQTKTRINEGMAEHIIGADTKEKTKGSA
jgi:putative tricarboxylic transport membrane protein